MHTRLCHFIESIKYDLTYFKQQHNTSESVKEKIKPHDGDVNLF